MNNEKNYIQLLLSDATGPINDLLKKLNSSYGHEWLPEFKKFLRKERTWDAKFSALSEHLGTVQIPTVEKFVASECFKENNSAGVKFAFISENFIKQFLGTREESS